MDYCSGGYNLGLRTSDLAIRALCLEAAVWGPAVSRATISRYGLQIQRLIHVSGRYSLGSYTLGL